MNLSLETIDQFLCYQFLTTRIIEKLVYKRLIKFLNKHYILYSSQYEFCNRHSTQHATLEILNEILSSFDKGQLTFCLFIDLKKTFDRVNYDLFFSQNSKIMASEEW